MPFAASAISTWKQGSGSSFSPTTSRFRRSPSHRYTKRDGRWSCSSRFFKWIKQHLRIKAFYGTSENAVKTQIWIAASVYVLVAIVRKRLMLPISLYQILQILSATPFEKTPTLQALQPSDSQETLRDNSNQKYLKF